MAKTTLIKGSTLTVYSDPITLRRPEGQAVLVEFISRDVDGGLERWKVHFEGDEPGSTYPRNISSG